MPGSPPSSTSDPGTMPPPSTRSNSLMPVVSRSASTTSTSAYSVARWPPGAGAALRALTAAPAPTGSSTSEFHAPQSGQRPSHFGDWKPQDWHEKRVRDFMAAASVFELPLDPRAQSTDDFPRDGADRGRHLTRRNLVVALPADDHHLVAGIDRHVRHVDGEHVHRDGADDRRAAAAHQHHAAAGQARIEAVGVAGRHDRDRPRLVGRPAQAIAGAFAAADPFDRDDTTRQ